MIISFSSLWYSLDSQAGLVSKMINKEIENVTGLL